MLDLYHATRDDLIRIILAQRDTIADQDRRIAALEQELAEVRQGLRQLTAQLGAGQAADDVAPPPGTPHGMPGHTPTQADSRAERPRRKRAKG